MEALDSAPSAPVGVPVVWRVLPVAWPVVLAPGLATRHVPVGPEMAHLVVQLPVVLAPGLAVRYALVGFGMALLVAESSGVEGLVAQPTWVPSVAALMVVLLRLAIVLVAQV